MLKNYTYLAPKETIIYYDKLGPITRLTKFGYVKQYSNASEATSALRQDVKSCSGSVIILAPNDEVQPLLSLSLCLINSFTQVLDGREVVGWDRGGKERNSECLADWIDQFAFRKSDPVVNELLTSTATPIGNALPLYNPFRLLATREYRDFVYPLMLRLPLLPHFSHYELVKLAVCLGFDRHDFHATIKESKPSKYLASRTPYVCYYFADKGSPNKFAKLLSEVKDPNATAFLAKTWPLWGMDDYYAVRKYLVRHYPESRYCGVFTVLSVVS